MEEAPPLCSGHVVGLRNAGALVNSSGPHFPTVGIRAIVIRGGIGTQPWWLSLKITSGNYVRWACGESANANEFSFVSFQGWCTPAMYRSAAETAHIVNNSAGWLTDVFVLALT